MEPHPRNADANSLDLAILVAMPVAIFVLLAVITYLAMGLL